MTAVKPSEERLVLLGAGALSTTLAVALERCGWGDRLMQVYSPGGLSAERLVAKLARPVAIACSLEEVSSEATGYILAVADDAVVEVAEALAPRIHGYLVHCSGATPLSVLSERYPLSGVLYPLSTFSRDPAVDTQTVPFYLEAASDALVPRLEALAYALSPSVTWVSSEQRLALHLGAVVACNFSNHLIATAEGLLQQYGLPEKALLPLLDEMLAKLHTMPAEVAQSGPARRGDLKTIARHRALLEGEEELLSLYDLMTDRIRRSY